MFGFLKKKKAAKDGDAAVTLMDGEVARLVFCVRGVSDIVHPFSVRDYEMLTPEFTGRLDALRPLIPKKAPVLLEITDCKLTEAERGAVENAVWTHYRIRLAEARKELNASRRKLMIFVPCLAAAAALLFLAKRVMSEVLTQYLYMPVWFFGYRILTYPIFDHMPLLREMRSLRQLAAMTVTVTETPGQPLTAAQRHAVAADDRSTRREAELSTLADGVKRQVLMEDGAVTFECRTDGAEELLDPVCPPGREMLSDALTGYLDQAEALADPDDTVRLIVHTPRADEAEQAAVKRGARNTYALRALGMTEQVKANLRMIGQFGVCMLLTGVALQVFGSRSDVAFHELLLITLWFFGDYLIEFVLLEHLRLDRIRRKWRRFAAMDITFDTVPEEQKD